MIRRVSCPVLVCLMLVACGSESPSGEPADEDVALDAGPDAPEVAGDADQAGDVEPEVDTTPDVDPDVGPHPDEGPDVPDEPVDCAPPLALDAEGTYVLPYGVVALFPSGGTGAYGFELEVDASGAMVHGVLGSYLAGGITGVDDVVTVTDEGCLGSASLTLHVTPHLVLQPTVVTLAPGGTFTFDIMGGSGFVGCLAASNASGATVTADGSYEAGPSAGTDVVLCTDAETSESRQATVKVVEGATILPAPARIAIPMGSLYEPHIEGGSGYYGYTVDGDAVSWSDGALHAETPGRATVTVTDLYLGDQATLLVDAVEALDVETIRAGDSSYHGVIVAPGDIDGDGLPDALLGLYEANISAFNSGAVYVYRGVEGGFDPEPARVISGTTRRDMLGRSLVAADFTGDGLVDLAVGADGYDPGMVDGGAVFIYHGQPGAFFDAAPAQVLPSLFPYDHAGYGVSACDYNDDGWMDLAVGVLYGENRDLEQQPTNQGAVYLFLGADTGFGPKPDQVIYGMLPGDDGIWTDAPDIRFGFALASGDTDGDGVCDLVATSRRYGAGPGRINDGAVFVFRGRPADDAQVGGVWTPPSRAWAADEAGNVSTQLGRNVAVGDLNGDGMAEIAASQPYHNNPAFAGANHGALRVFAGVPWSPSPDPTPLQSVTTADWTVLGNSSWDNYGWNTNISDVDGDAIGDLLVTSLADEVDGQPGGTGTVDLYAGVEGALPDGTPTWVRWGLATGDYFGVAVAGVGDLDDDGLAELLVLAGQDSTIGLDVGRPYMAHLDGITPHDPLGLPGEASGSRVATTVGLAGDLDGDGYPEVVVASPDVDVEGFDINVGVATIHAGSAEGFSAEPTVVLQQFTGHSRGDRFAEAAAGAGDFDGDGYPDLAVVSRYDDSPGSFGAGFSHDGTCVGSRSNPGAVYIFRGQAGAMPDGEPDFIWYGSQNGQAMRVLAADLDINGDGLSDFVAGDLAWDRQGATNAGGFGVVFGRPADGAGLLQVICEADFVFVGLFLNDYLAQSMAAVGDLNGDGCDEFAVGARAEDLGLSNQGTVRVFFGWGGAGCPTEPTYVLLQSQFQGAQAGYALAGGLDATGDGVPDILVGGPRSSVDGATTGSAWLLSGAAIAALSAQPVTDGQVATTIHPFIPLDTQAGTWRIDGEADDAWFGLGVALVPNMSAPGRAGLAIGAPYGKQSGVLSAGGVQVFRFEDDPAQPSFGIDPLPVASMGGETDRTGGRMGAFLAAGLAGDDPILVTGGWESSALGLDEGAAYVMNLGDQGAAPDP